MAAEGENGRLLPPHSDRPSYQSIPIGQPRRPSDASDSSFSTSSTSSSTLPSYSWLILSHALGIVPTLLFLAAFTAAALKQPCRLPKPTKCGGEQHLNEDKAAQHCSQLLGPASMLSWSLFLLSVAAFTAAHKVRNLISRLCTLALRLGRACSLASMRSSLPSPRASLTPRVPDETSRYDLLAKNEDDTAATIFSFVSRALFTEGFKILLIVVASAVVLAKTLVDVAGDQDVASSLPASTLRHHSKQQRHVPRFTQLEAQDGRFRIAVWLALGWATAELLSGTVQLFRQLSMYSPTLLDEAGEAFLLGGHGEGGIIEEEDEDDLDVVGGVDLPHSLAQGKAAQQEGEAPSEQGSIYRGQNPGAAALSSARQTLQSQRPRSSSSSSSAASHTPPQLDATAIRRLESQIDRLIAARTRVKLERTLGASLPDLPVAISAVWRLDSALWSTGSVLLLSAAVALGQGVTLFGSGRHRDEEAREGQPRLFPAAADLWITFTVLAALYAVFHSVWRLALASWWVTYPSLLVGLGMVVAGLARWGLVV